MENREIANREIALILLNMQMDMDYADYLSESDSCLEVELLAKEIGNLKDKDSSLFYVLENIALQNRDITILVDGTEEE